MADDALKPQQAQEPPDAAASEDGPPGSAKLVPVSESIRYRRRAQQAEGRLQEIEQQLKDIRTQQRSGQDELATAEAQRDEARHEAQTLENRLAVERRLNAAGVVDVEVAADLLAKRVDLGTDLDQEAIARSVEQLLLDKPFLRAEMPTSLPPKTAAARSAQASQAAQLARFAERAVRTGDRRDVAEYLRLRRQTTKR